MRAEYSIADGRSFEFGKKGAYVIFLQKIPSFYFAIFGVK